MRTHSSLSTTRSSAAKPHSTFSRKGSKNAQQMSWSMMGKFGSHRRLLGTVSAQLFISSRSKKSLRGSKTATTKPTKQQYIHQKQYQKQAFGWGRPHKPFYDHLFRDLRFLLGSLLRAPYALASRGGGPLHLRGYSWVIGLVILPSVRS